MTSVLAWLTQGVAAISSVSLFESFLQYCLILFLTAKIRTDATCLGKFFRQLVLYCSIFAMSSND